MNKKRNAFISHKGIDDESFQTLKDTISKEFDISDDTIDNLTDNEKTKEEEEEEEKEIERLLKIRINEAEIFICLIDENTHIDDWVNSEIEYAHLCGKRIVGIFANGVSNNVEIPENCKKYGGPILTLNSLDKLNEVLDGANMPNETPDGKPSPPLYKFPPRVKC